MKTGGDEETSRLVSTDDTPARRSRILVVAGAVLMACLFAGFFVIWSLGSRDRAMIRQLKGDVRTQEGVPPFLDRWITDQSLRDHYKQITELDLFDRAGSRRPHDYSNLIHLTDFRLEGKDAEIPEVEFNFSGCKSLKKAHFISRDGTADFSGCTNLSKVFWYKGVCTRFPNMEGCRKLRSFSIHGSRFTTMPRLDAPDLFSFFVDAPLVQWPDLSGIPNVEELGIKGDGKTPLKVSHPWNFPKLSQLECYDLNLEELPSLASSEELTSLHLYQVGLIRLPQLPKSIAAVHVTSDRLSDVSVIKGPMSDLLLYGAGQMVTGLEGVSVDNCLALSNIRFPNDTFPIWLFDGGPGNAYLQYLDLTQLPDLSTKRASYLHLTALPLTHLDPDRLPMNLAQLHLDDLPIKDLDITALPQTLYRLHLDQLNHLEPLSEIAHTNLQTIRIQESMLKEDVVINCPNLRRFTLIDSDRDTWPEIRGNGAYQLIASNCPNLTSVCLHQSKEVDEDTVKQLWYQQDQKLREQYEAK